MSKPKGIVDWLAEDSPMAKAREAERAATEALIVAYLRQYPAYQTVADAIERGEHRK